jgi:LAO/AO transport system kinase
VCEAAGFDAVLVETVGVGQSETALRGMVDFFMLLMLPGGGDDLQGIKRGIIELADAVIINKADGDHLALAKIAQNDYSQALTFIRPVTHGWKTRTLTCSALHNKGIDKIYKMVQDFFKTVKQNGQFKKRRQEQKKSWFHFRLAEELKLAFYEHPEIKVMLPELEKQVESDYITPIQAVDTVFKNFGWNKA